MCNVIACLDANSLLFCFFKNYFLEDVFKSVEAVFARFLVLSSIAWTELS